MLSLAVLSLALAADQEAGYEADNVSVDDLLALMVERGEARATAPMQLNQALSAKVKGTKKKCTATLMGNPGISKCSGPQLWESMVDDNGVPFVPTSKSACFHECTVEIKIRQEEEGNTDSASSCCQFHNNKCTLHDSSLTEGSDEQPVWESHLTNTVCEYPLATGLEITPYEVMGVKKCCEEEVAVDSNYILPMHTCKEVRNSPFQEVYEAMMALERKTGITNAEIKDWLAANDCRVESFPTVAPTKLFTAHAHKPHKHCPHSHRHSESSCSAPCGGGTKSFCKREERNADVDGCENFCGHEEVCNMQACPTPEPTAYPTPEPTVTPTAQPTLHPTPFPTPSPTEHICDRHAMGEAVSNCASQDKNGICYKVSDSSEAHTDATTGLEYRCGCRSGYYCSAGCESQHDGHICTKITETPTNYPTPAPTPVPTPAPTPESVDCVGAWSDFSSCSHACGEEGKWVRVYKISVQSAHGGLECHHEHSEVEEASCNRHQCGCSHVHCLFERKEVYINAGRIKATDRGSGKAIYAKDISMGGQFYLHKSIVVRHDAREKYGSKHKCGLANKGLEQEECRCICANHIEEDSDHWEDCHKDGHLFQESCGRKDSEEERKKHRQRKHETDLEGGESHWLHDQSNRYPKGLAKATPINQRKFFHSCNKVIGVKNATNPNGCRSEAYAMSRYAPITDINEDWKELTGDEKAGHQHLVSEMNGQKMGCAVGYKVILTTNNKYVCVANGGQQVFHPDIISGSPDAFEAPESNFLDHVKMENYYEAHRNALAAHSRKFFSN